MCLRAPHPSQPAIGLWLQALQSPTCCASVPLLLSQFQQASPGWGKPCVLPSTRSSLGPAPCWRHSVPRARGASPISPAPQEAGAWRGGGARPALSALLAPGCQRGASARGRGSGAAERCRAAACRWGGGAAGCTAAPPASSPESPGAGAALPPAARRAGSAAAGSAAPRGPP